MRVSGLDYLASDGVRDGKAVMNTVMKTRVPKNAGSLLVDEEMLASQEELRCMKFVSYLLRYLLT